MSANHDVNRTADDTELTQLRAECVRLRQQLAEIQNECDRTRATLAEVQKERDHWYSEALAWAGKEFERTNPMTDDEFERLVREGDFKPLEAFFGELFPDQARES